MSLRFELNITMQCNVFCPNCNRMCDMYPNRHEHMHPDQIRKFVEQLKASGEKVQRLKIVGGEPLLHPEFGVIHDILVKAAQQGLIEHIKIDSNRKTKRPPKISRSKYVRWSGRPPEEKRHIPPLWSPKDHGFTVTHPCAQIRRCGYSLDKYGYLPCSVSIMLVRILGLTHLYRNELPTKPWGLGDVCEHCSTGMDYKWRDENAIKISDIKSEHKEPSCTFKDALEKFNLDEFYSTHVPF